MMEIIKLLPFLAVAVIANIATGMYFKIGKEKIKFSGKIFGQGVIKAFIVSGGFIALAYISTSFSVDVAPKVLIASAISLYTGKLVTNLCDIFGIKINK